MIITPDIARRATLAVRCPHCHAAVGNRCIVPSSGKALTATGCHPARATANTVGDVGRKAS